MKVSKFIVLIGSSLILVHPSQAQMGKMKWTFKSRPEVTSALQKTRGNLHSTYEVLICAARQGYSITPLKYYEAITKGHEFDARIQDSASFAFSYDLANGFRPWYWRKDPMSLTYKGTNAATVSLFRDRAFKYAPASPEVLTMRAFWLHFSGLEPKRKQAYNLALKAIKFAPRWADAYYWLGESCENYALSFADDVWPVVKKQSSKEIMVKLGKQGMQSYDKAEKLNPTLRPYLYVNRIGLCRLIADKEAAREIPIYAEAYLQAFPTYQDWYRKKMNQPDKDVKVMYDQLAMDIAKNATH